jgi:hypothetical protein
MHLQHNPTDEAFKSDMPVDIEFSYKLGDQLKCTLHPQRGEKSSCKSTEEPQSSASKDIEQSVLEI